MLRVDTTSPIRAIKFFLGSSSVLGITPGGGNEVELHRIYCLARKRDIKQTYDRCYGESLPCQGLKLTLTLMDVFEQGLVERLQGVVGRSTADRGDCVC